MERNGCLLELQLKFMLAVLLWEKKKVGWASSKDWKVLLSQLISKKDYKVSFK